MSTTKKNREQLQLLRDEALEAYMNREDFQYDVNADALYQQYKDRYMEMGRDAMEDTMGQAAALTGGYGSSYSQSVGQQAYNSYLQQLGDVVPELYQLAYDRYQDKGDQLYKTYQSWAELEQQAAEQEQWEQEYALAERKRQDENTRFQIEQENKKSDTSDKDQNPYGDLPDYYAWLATYQGKGQRTKADDPTVVIQYDNGNVTTGNIMILQRILGLQETGMWTYDDQNASKMTADQAWAAYQEGKLQNRTSHGMGDMALETGKVMMMERVLGLPEDGYWSDADKAAAGNMSQFEAWEFYQQGKLQNWR